MKRTLLFLALHFIFFTSVFAQTSADSLTLKKGFWGYSAYQNEKKLSVKELTKILKPYPDASKQFESAEKIRQFTVPAGIIGYGMLGWSLGQATSGKTNWALLSTSVGLIAVTLPFEVKRIRYMKSAIKTYNDRLKKPEALNNDIKISMSGNRVGLSLTF